MSVGTPLQAIKFAREIYKDCGSAEIFLQHWLEGTASGFSLTDGLTFDDFCLANPDEPERPDGRKVHYGAGRQPLDDIVDAGWGPAFCAGNVLKYLRRDKMLDDSQQKARWYWQYLNGMCRDDDNYPKDCRRSLEKLLTQRELVFLRTGAMPK